MSDTIKWQEFVVLKSDYENKEATLEELYEDWKDQKTSIVKPLIELCFALRTRLEEEKKTSNTAGWVKIPEANLRAIEAENAALTKKLERTIFLADYFASQTIPPDPHEEGEGCQDCDYRREIAALLREFNFIIHNDKKVHFDEKLVCDNCMGIGAYDIMGDVLCKKCFKKLKILDGE